MSMPSSAAIFDMRSAFPPFFFPSFMDLTWITGSGDGGLAGVAP